MFSGTLSQRIAVSVVYVVAFFMTILDSTIVNVALPAMGQEFGVPSASANGIVFFYLVAVAAAMPVSGWFGDRFGERNVLLWAVLLFMFASALCGRAQTLQQLEFFRVLQGLAGGLMTPVGMALMWRTFPPEDRAKASAILMIPTAVAPTIGPLLGGYLVSYLSWRWIFYINLPIAFLTLVFGLLFLAKSPRRDAGPFDWLGFLLASSGLGLLMYGVSQGPFVGWGQVDIVLSVGVGAFLLAALLWVQLRMERPLLRFRLLQTRLFGVSNAVILVGGIGFMGTMYLTSIFYQDGLGMSASEAGKSLFPEAIGVMVGSQLISKFMYPKLGPRRVLFACLMVSAAMVASMAFVTHTSSIWLPRGLLFALGMAMSGVFIAVEAAAFAQTSDEDMGAASTLLNTQLQIGEAAGVAMMTTVFMAILPAVGSVQASAPSLRAYHTAYLVAALFGVAGALLALLLRDEDAAATFLSKPR